MIYNFYIDSETRKIKHEAMTVMRMDHNVHTIRFTVEDPEDFTFDGASILIKAVLPNKEKVEITPENIVIEDIVEIEDEVERVTGHSASFDWTLKQSVTRHAGPVTYSICALRLALDGTTVSQEWHTIDDTFKIFDHKHFDGSDDQDDPDMQATNAEKIAALKNTVSSINTKVNGLASGAPPTADSTDDMDADESTVYINTADGNWYYWDGSAWQIGGQYGGAVDSGLDLSDLTLSAQAASVEGYSTLTLSDDNGNSKSVNIPVNTLSDTDTAYLDTQVQTYLQSLVSDGDEGSY